MDDQTDPKGNDLRHSPGTEKILRQWLTLESVNAASPAYRRHYETAFGKPTALASPVHCGCGYEARTLEEVHWHERLPGHECL